MRVATIGVFDGVHRGHQALVAAAARLAGHQGEVVAVTFDPHPLAVLRPDLAPALLTTIDRRVQLLRDAGAADVVVLPFTPELAAQSPEEFVDRLVGAPGTAGIAGEGIGAIVAGDNFRFGKGAAGDPGTLAELGASRGYVVEVLTLISEDVPGEGPITWSSTYVRGRIAAGDLPAATHVLGRPHRVTGTVVHGDHRGRELGYPTANLDLDVDYALPPDGVCAGRLVLGDGGTDSVMLPAAVSIGTNPHFGGVERRVEAHVLGRDDLDLYGQGVGVDLVDRIRGQQVFDSVDGLIAQMARDVAEAAERLQRL